MKDDKSGRHEWIIEFKKHPECIDSFTEILDDALQSINSDYEAKRTNNMTLDLPKINTAREGLFYDWLKYKNKLGGQHKVPRLSNSREHLEEILSLS